MKLRASIFLTLAIAGVLVGIKPKTSVRVWTLDQIEKTGLKQKCEEVKKLRAENLVTKADKIWEQFQKKNPGLFENQSLYSLPSDILALPGKWVPITYKNNNINAVICQEKDESCRKAWHSFDDFSSMSSDVGAHFHFGYDDLSFPKQLREVFEQAAHDGFLLKDVRISSTRSSILDLVSAIEAPYSLFENCDLGLRGNHDGRFAHFTVSKEKAKNLGETTEQEVEK